MKRRSIAVSAAVIGELMTAAVALSAGAADPPSPGPAANVALVRALGGGFIAPAVAETSKISNEKGPAHG